MNRPFQSVLKTSLILSLLSPSAALPLAAQSAGTAGQAVLGTEQTIQQLGGKGEKNAGQATGIGSKDAPTRNPTGQDKTSQSKTATTQNVTASTTKLRLSPTAPSTPPKDLPKHRPVIGLALGGGAAVALSEIGTLQWMEEHHIPVDVIAGTSMGSILAALYSTGKTPDELRHVLTGEQVSRVFRIDTSYSNLSFRRREEDRELPNGIQIGLKHGVSLRNSILTDTGLNELLDKEFLNYNDQTDFNNLPIPFRCQATDLTAAKTVTFARGSLADAVRASASIPGVFRPFELDKHEYVDGAILENLPTQDVKAMKADVIIAVSLPLQPVGKGDLDSILGVLQRAFAVGIEANERTGRQLANILIMPDTKGFTANDYLRTDKLAKLGYDAAETHKAELMRYALSQTDWDVYLAARRSRERPPAGTVLRVKVEAPDPDLREYVEHVFNPLVSKPVDTNEIESLLADIRSDGRYEADYTVGYDGPISNRPIILVNVHDKKTGPPFLNLGLNIAAQTAGVTRATLSSILLWQDIGGYGSGFRANIDVGFVTRVQAEYYWKPNPYKGYFVAPRANLTREPFYIYQNNYRLSERQSQFGGVGADVGWSDSRYSEVRAGWSLQHVSWFPTTGQDNLPNYFGNSQVARVRYIFDNQNRALVPRYGIRLATNLGYLYATPGSPSAPQILSQFSFAHEIGRGGRTKSDIFLLNAEGGTLFNRDVAQPFRYTLGGPLRVSSLAVGQLRGTDYFLMTPGYLHRLATLPAPLGQSIYAGFAYEVGQMYAPNTNNVMRQDVYFGIVAETPLGVITLGPALGNAGQHKFVFTLGRFFSIPNALR